VPDRALLVARRFQPTVVVLDASLPGGTWREVAQLLRREIPTCGLLLLDDTLRPWNLKEAIEFPRVGYWTKCDSAQEVIEAARAVAVGEGTFCAQAKRFLISSEGKLRFRALPADSPLARLTRREQEVLVHLAQGHSIKECARRLDLAHSTVDNHKSRIMKKLGVHKLVDLVRLALREGLVPE